MFAKGEKQKLQSRAEESHASAATAFQEYGRPLDAVFPFNLLRRVLTASDYYWPVVVSNLMKERQKWARMSRVLGWEGAGTRTSGMFNKGVVQANLLFGLDTSLMTPILVGPL